MRNGFYKGHGLGNDYLVVDPEELDLARLGPELETHRIFPRATNVQLARVSGPHSLDVLVWERGAGVTEASGSSASAAACAAVRRGLVESPVRVDLPGGSLGIEVGADFDVVLHGEVSEVARGSLCAAFLRELGVRAR